MARHGAFDLTLVSLAVPDWSLTPEGLFDAYLSTETEDIAIEDREILLFGPTHTGPRWFGPVHSGPRYVGSVS